MTVPQRVLDIMNSGEVYAFDDPEILQAQADQMELLYEFNTSRPSEPERRRTIAEKLLGGYEEGAWIEPPLHANWGCNTYFGRNAYANFNLTLVDDGEVHIGEKVMIGPNVTITTTGHPIRPDLRERATQYSLPVTIGRNVWIGANVTILPGVTIGENSVIGACSLVTRDIPANVVAYGQPCKVVREMTTSTIGTTARSIRRSTYCRSSRIDVEPTHIRQPLRNEIPRIGNRLVIFGFSR